MLAAVQIRREKVLPSKLPNSQRKCETRKVQLKSLAPLAFPITEFFLRFITVY